jgi:hypothetical protein
MVAAMTNHPLEALLFGTSDGREIERLITEWSHEHLGSSPTDVLFGHTSVGHTRGLGLADGRAVVVKVHRREVGIDRLRAIQSVQTQLAQGGFPAPRPLVPPHVLGNGIVTGEAFMDGSRLPNGHDSLDRDEMAAELARLVPLTKSTGAEVRAALGSGAPPWADYRGPGLWATPHNPSDDFAIGGGTGELIDRLAARAQTVLRAPDDLPTIVVHVDWEAQNMRFTGERLAVVYDWDSLVIEREAVAVGMAAATFAAGVGAQASRPEREAFLAAYQRSAARAFAPSEIVLALAGGCQVVAYTARLHY